MAHDVFVSHSSKDKIAADAAVAHLERKGLRCWCAPRDIVSGSSWAASIVEAINSCKAMVVIFSTNANESGHISREVERAVNRAIPVVPVRIEDVLPRGDLEYFFSSSHWMDAITPPMERHFDRLAEQLRVLLKLDDKTDSARLETGSTTSSVQPRRLAVPLVAIGAIALAALCAVLIYHRHNTSGPSAVAPANTPPAPAPSANSSASQAMAVSQFTPAPAATSTNEPGVSPLAGEFEEWKKLARISWDNSYLTDHARQRYPEWRRAADQGDPIGQFFVGYAFLHGLTVPEDPSTGLSYFIKSAEQNNTDAMVGAASCSGLGIGTQPNPVQYGRWIKQALDNGNTSAMFTHGAVLFGLSPIQSDKEEGKRLVAKAVAAGNLEGVYWLAVVNASVPNKFASNMKKAADGGQPDALFVRAEGLKRTDQGRKMVAQALKIMGNPLSVARIIDPSLPFGFNHTNLYPDLAWKRLREMADEGSTEATRLVEELRKKGKAP